MRIGSAVMLTAILWGTIAASGQAQTSVSQDARDVADALGFGFTLSQIADGQTPTLDHLDEFLDLAGFDVHRLSDGRRWFDVPYKTTKTTISVALKRDDRQLWVRLDLIKVRPGNLQRTALLTRLNTGRPLAQGEYRIANNDRLFLTLALDTDTVSEGDLRRAIRTLIEQADASAGVWFKWQGFK